MSFMSLNGATLSLRNVLLCSLAVASISASAAVDATNMGKGDYVWDLPTAITNTGTGTVQGFLDYEKAQGMRWIVVNCGRGGTWYTQFNTDLITRAHTTGLNILGYERCFGDSVTSEVEVGKKCLQLGADGFVINAEIEYEGKNAQATQMMNGLRAAYPNAFIAHAPFVYIDWHTAFPYVEFGKQCNAVMPQCYWRAAGINKAPDLMVADMNTQWNKWHQTWTSQGNGTAVKPIIPIGDGYNTSAGPEIPLWFTSLNTTTNCPNSFGYTGTAFWSAQHHDATHWANIGAGTLSGYTPPPTTTVVVDNSNTAFTASSNWSVGSSAADKYGNDYRFRSTAAISDSAVWNVSVNAAGTYSIYAWWAQGTNRSTTAPYVIPGNVTVKVNQQANGGKWNLLGSANLVAGNNQVKLSCWTSTGTVVLADGVKAVKQ